MNERISQLPTAPSAITGAELVPIVQNGLTVQTTVSAITQSPSLTETFLTVGQQTLLPNSRYFSATNGIGIADGGAQGAYTITLNGTSGSLEGAGTGVIVKSAANTITARTLSTSGNGISVTNGDGVSGNPTFQLTGLALAIANATGTGLLGLNGSTLSPLTITGTTNQISVTNGNGASGNPVISLASNPIIPGTASMTVPVGTTAQRDVGANGEIRFNSDTVVFEGFAGGTWKQFSLTGGVTSFSAGSTGFSPSSATSGAVTLSGILNPANGGTGASSLTGYLYGNGSSAATASTTIPTTNLSGTITNAQLANSAVTINGTTVSLGGSSTITAAAPYALTFGTGLNAGSYTGSVATTISLSNTGVSANTYTAATITVDAQGRITSASSGSVGSVTSVSVSTANGFGGTVSNPSTTPTITLSTTVTGVVYGNGTALSAATGAQIATAIGASTVTNATNATTLTGGSAGTLVYQSATGTTSYLALGNTNYVLIAGASVPQYVAQSTLSVGSATTATTATTATNVTGGAAGSLVYQTAASTTSTLALGTNNYVLTAGATAPQYVAQSTLSVGSATTATNATNTAITEDTTTAVSVYPTWVTANTGNLPQKTTSTKLSFIPSTGVLTATGGIGGGTF